MAIMTKVGQPETKGSQESGIPLVFLIQVAGIQILGHSHTSFPGARAEIQIKAGQ